MAIGARDQFALGEIWNNEIWMFVSKNAKVSSNYLGNILDEWYEAE